MPILASEKPRLSSPEIRVAVHARTPAEAVRKSRLHISTKILGAMIHEIKAERHEQDNLWTVTGLIDYDQYHHAQKKR